MRTYLVKRGFKVYEVDADTRGKAKYAAYRAYKKSKRSPKAFFPWVVSVKSVTVKP